MGNCYLICMFLLFTGNGSTSSVEMSSLCFTSTDISTWTWAVKYSSEVSLALRLPASSWYYPQVLWYYGFRTLKKNEYNTYWWNFCWHLLCLSFISSGTWSQTICSYPMKVTSNLQTLVFLRSSSTEVWRIIILNKLWSFLLLILLTFPLFCLCLYFRAESYGHPNHPVLG